MFFGKDNPIIMFLLMDITIDKLNNIIQPVVLLRIYLNPYDKKIDTSITDILLKNEKLSYSELKNKINKVLKRNLSHEVYCNHLKVMQAEKILNKDSTNQRGRKVLFSLTHEARKRMQLEILGDASRQLIFKRIYEKILFYDFINNLYRLLLTILRESEPVTVSLIDRDILLPDRTVKMIIIKSEPKLATFLADLKIKSTQLNWGLFHTTRSEIENIIYPSSSFKIGVHRKKLELMNYPKQLKKILTHNDQRDIVERLYFITVPKNHDEFLRDNFWIHRVEDWKIWVNKKNQLIANLKLRRYYAFIPGVSVQDVFSGLGNSNSKYKTTDVADAIDLLAGSKLIKQIKFGRDTRYVIADSELHHFISGLKEYFVSEFWYLFFKWEYFQLPTESEKKRMESIFGKNEFKQIVLKAEVKLVEHKRRMSDCQNINEYHDMFVKEIDSPLSVPFISMEEFVQYRKTNKIKPRTKKHHKTDIKEYRDFLQKKLETKMERLSICCVEHNEIELFKMSFESVIGKYSFLRDIITKICPKVLEPPNRELRNAIMQTDVSRGLAAQEFARQLNAITTSSMETDRRIIKHVEYVHGKKGKVQPVLNINKMSDEKQTEDDDLE